MEICQVSDVYVFGLCCDVCGSVVAFVESVLVEPCYAELGFGVEVSAFAFVVFMDFAVYGYECVFDGEWFSAYIRD